MNHDERHRYEQDYALKRGHPVRRYEGEAEKPTPTNSVPEIIPRQPKPGQWIVYTDKPWHVYAVGDTEAEAIGMALRAGGIPLNSKIGRIAKPEEAKP